jgi:hypothetical protein
LNYYYPDRFPTLWDKFDTLVKNEKIISVREVKNELERYSKNDLNRFVNLNNFFSLPTEKEADFIKQIFSNNHFQMILKDESIKMGYPQADPFVIAKAKLLDGYVVTNEKYAQNSAKIPNICEFYDIKCIDFQEFMKIENWQF